MSCSSQSIYDGLCATRAQALADLATAYTQLATLEAQAVDLAATLPDSGSTAQPDYNIGGGGGTQHFAKGTLYLGIQDNKRQTLAELGRLVDVWNRKIDGLISSIEKITKTMTLILPYQYISATVPGRCY